MKINVDRDQKENIEGMTNEYPYVMHAANINEVPIPWHWHEEVEFEYVNSGALEVTTINRTYRFHANEAFFMNTNVLCAMKSGESEPETFITSHLFNEIFLGGHFKSIFQTKYITPILQNKNIDIVEIRGVNNRQKQILAKLKVVARIQREQNSEFQTRNLFSEIWLLLLEEIAESERKQVTGGHMNQDRIQTMLSYIHQKYGEKVTLEDIAGSAAISKRECTRCFQKSIQKTPVEYLMEYRIGKAEKLLICTEELVVDIAMQTGFSSNAYFGKIFKQQRGVTPAMYRKKHAKHNKKRLENDKI